MSGARSTTPNILVYHPRSAEKYKTRLEQAEIGRLFAASTPEEAAAVMAETEIVFGLGIPTWVLRGQSSVRWIQSMSAGVDAYMKNREDLPPHATLTRIVDQYSVPMAEYVFSYLLYLAKGLQRHRNAQDNRRWDPFVPQGLAGKTIGVAGIGSIGGEVIRKARAFDMNVYGLSLTGSRAGTVDKHFGPADWLSFVRNLDVLVLILPLTDQTEEVVNREVLSAMQEHAILVNIGRGKLIDQTALLEVMQKGHLQAAVLDVFEQEPLPDTSPLWGMSNVYITPHISGLNSVSATTDYFLANLRRYQSGEPLAGVVDLNKQY